MKIQKSKNPHTSPVLLLMQFAFMSLGNLLPGIMGNWAYKLWFSPARFKTPHHEIEAEKTSERLVVTVNDVDISVLSWGQGPAVLFIHGWMGRGTQAGYFVQDLVSAGYRVISFDAPAHGKTPGKQTNILEITEVVLELNRKYGPFEAAITHSFGGMILAYAMTLGLKIRKVVNICPAADFDTIVDNFKHKLRIPDAVIQVMLARLKKNFGADMPEKVSTLNNVKGLDASALIIHDENDEDIPWQSGKAIADAWKGAGFILTRGLGHRKILRDPETVRLTVDFISGR